MGWERICRPALVAAALALLLLVCAAPVTAQDEDIRVELNKLEADGESCRAYLVLENGLDEPLESLRLDLVMFDADGIIARRLAVETAPLPAGKTRVKAFGIGDTSCGDISRVLLNDVLDCETASGDRGDCLERLRTDSAGDIPFIQ